MKKLLTSLLSLCITDACAETAGDYEYDLLEDGTAKITSYTGTDTKLVIPAELDGHPVTAIAFSAFIDAHSHKKLKHVILPEGVTDIDPHAFTHCHLMKSITFPDSVTTLVAGTFAHCTGLTTMRIPNTLVSLEDNPFPACSKLNAFEVSPDHPTLTVIDGVLFDKAAETLICYPAGRAAESYTIPGSVKAIGVEAFSGCGALTSITIPDSLNTIGHNAFSECSALTSIVIPDSVTRVGVNPFLKCGELSAIEVSPGHPNLAVIGGMLIDKAEQTLICYPGGLTADTCTVPEGIRHIGSNAFACCAALRRVTLPDSVTDIGVHAFGQCPQLNSVRLPSGLAAIAKYTFAGCTALTDITLPNSVTSIGSMAFRHCDSLTALTIPDGVTDIDYHAFHYCDVLTLVVSRYSPAAKHCRDNGLPLAFSK